MISDIGILTLILADSTRHRYHSAFVFYARASLERVYGALCKNIRAPFGTIHAATPAFLSGRIDDSLLITIPLIVNSDARRAAGSSGPLHRAARRCGAAPKIRVRRAAAVTYRLNEGKYSRGSVISIIAPRKRNRTRKIFIFCTAVNDESNRGNARPETGVSTGSF